MIRTQEVGIHIGYSRIVVSRWRLDRTIQFTYEIKNVITISDRGEILFGERAEKYHLSHSDSSLIPLLSLFEKHGWKDSSSFLIRGLVIRLSDIFTQAMTELYHGILGQLKEEGAVPCVISISADQPDVFEFLRKHMSRAGFQVLRILSSPAACSLYHRVNYLTNLSEELSLRFAAVEGKTALLSTAELNPDGVIELITTEEFSLEEYTHRFRNEKNDISTLNYIDPAHKTLFSSEDKLYDLPRTASRGAAVQAQKIMRIHDIAPDLLLLDVTSASYTIQFLDRNKEPLHQPVELISSKTAIPCKCSFLYVCGTAENAEAILRIMVHDCSNEKLLQMTDLNIQAIFSEFDSNHDALITMELDVAKLLTLTIEEKDTRRCFTKNIGLSYETKIPSNFRERKTKQQIQKKLLQEIRQFQSMLIGMEDSERLDGTEKGLVMIGKSCTSFAEKHLSSIEGSDAYYSVSGLTTLCQDWIEILDQMDYGVSEISEQPEDSSLCLLARTYKNFRDCADKYLQMEMVEAEGLTFDPHIHEAVSYEIHSGLEENDIIDEVLPGYRCMGQLLRPSRVRVSKE